MRQEKEEKEFNGLKAVRQLLRSKINRKQKLRELEGEMVREEVNRAKEKELRESRAIKRLRESSEGVKESKKSVLKDNSNKEEVYTLEGRVIQREEKGSDQSEEDGKKRLVFSKEEFERLRMKKQFLSYRSCQEGGEGLSQQEVERQF